MATIHWRCWALIAILARRVSVFHATARPSSLASCFWGLGLQFALCFPGAQDPIRQVFQAISAASTRMLDYAEAGSSFVFGDKLGAQNRTSSA